MLDKGAWPYWSVAAFSPSNKFFKAGPLGACGQCYEIKCIDKDGPLEGALLHGGQPGVCGHSDHGLVPRV